MFFTVFTTARPGVAERRKELLKDFVAYMGDREGHPDVVVHYGGSTLAEDGATINGLLLVLEGPSLETVRAFVANSPFAKADLWAEVQVRGLQWVRRGPDDPSVSP